jgi:DNA-binding LytR/AlgR family response regulator
MAAQLQGTNVMRCHRSYLVNMEQVRVLRRDKEGFFIEMGINGVPDLPVSKTYSEEILKWLAM